MRKMTYHIILIICLLCFSLGCSEQGALNLLGLEDVSINDSPVFYNKDEMRDLFYENQAEFERVAEIVINNEVFLEYMRDNNKMHDEIRWKSQKHFFSNEEWERICSFLNTVKLLSVIRYDYPTVNGRGMLRFATTPEKRSIFSTKETSVSICFLDSSGASIEQYVEYYVETYIEDLDNNWYLIEKTI